MKEKNKTRRRRYDAEFKANALKLLEDGRSVCSVAESLGIQESLLYAWRRKASKIEEPSSMEDLEQEMKRLRKRLKTVELERDILKKALSIFSRAT